MRYKADRFIVFRLADQYLELNRFIYYSQNYAMRVLSENLLKTNFCFLSKMHFYSFVFITSLNMLYFQQLVFL